MRAIKINGQMIIFCLEHRVSDICILFFFKFHFIFLSIHLIPKGYLMAQSISCEKQ
jgi:hypothetical protein